ncbi:transketolase [Rhodovibrio sodomensis]|uniref:Transketolase n=1 Tax=Rhodovibrio sodomensis TaxID=1088 RepID=A0ABS1DC83_9PROT|nr:transketolase [Rhodovibrio sodomensis]MBK1667742.1 transketolase [Rhodovibrio sodomensis]
MDTAQTTASTLGSADQVTHNDMANAIRALAMDAVQKAQSGHPGMPMGMADVATVLFNRFLKFDPKRPDWPDRDRFVLSAGHGSMLLYSLLYLTGYEDMTLEELKNFRQLGSKTAGHPEYGEAGGIETTTGPLGQGFGNAVGMALAERILNARFGDHLVDHWTYVIASDGDLMEGISHEAASIAGHLGLGRLVVLFDDNGISIDGSTDLADSVDQVKRFEAYGWHALRVDGHDPAAVAEAIEAARASDKPSLIACKTTIGYGAPKLAGSEKSHGAPLGEDEIAGAREKLGWPHGPFEIPEPILHAWRQVGAAGGELSAAWDGRLRGAGDDIRTEFLRRQEGRLPEGLGDAISAVKRTLLEEKPKVATRKASQTVLEALVERIPEMIGGSADLSGSNNTKTSGHQVVTRGDYAGNYVHWGVREHGMAAAMNGLALHGGVIPYSGTFLIFSDYARPSIRLAAMNKLRTIHVMTHDSIGLGEDGPTHQPIEHLASLRAMPRLRVLRPADAVETAECWQVALESADAPSVLALSRQGLPALRAEGAEENYCRYGAYILVPAQDHRQVTLLASGSEVHVAVEARAMLAEEGISAAVVSMPSWDIFLDQPAHYRDEVLGTSALRVAIEAASGFGWERWTTLDGAFVGMKGFGASAPTGDLYKHFGITPEAVVSTVKDWL